MSPLHAHRQGFIILVLLTVGTVSLFLLKAQARRQVVEAGFWFEDVTFDASEVEADRLGGGITPEEMTTIQAVARRELADAFAGMRIVFGGNRKASYVVRVVQTVQNPIFRRGIFAGESRGIWPFGGYGAVNFRLIASHAIAYAPPGTDRASRIVAIGRGVGRAAAHEFAHQILGGKDIHHGRDIGSYEYWNADRREQYYGPMHWDVAGPMLRSRLGQ